jgi:hypothetical protein
MRGLDGRSWTCLTLLLAVVLGCSKPSQPPAEFARQVSQADHIVATNPYVKRVVTIRGEEFSRVAKAVVTARHDKNGYKAVFDCVVQFCAETNVLTVIYLQDRTFWAGRTQYSDDTGVLKAFYVRLENDAAYRLSDESHEADKNRQGR